MKQSLKMMPAWLFAHDNDSGITEQQAVLETPQSSVYFSYDSQNTSELSTLETARLQTPHTENECINICTIAGNKYLIKAVTLYRSLETRSNEFMLYICCTDDLSYHALCKLKLERCVPVMLSELNDASIGSLRAARTQSEFCWTLKSFFMLYLLKNVGLQSVLYCDSDVCFFWDPKLIFEDWGESSIYLCTQRDLDWVEERYGKYQAGIIGFRGDRIGIAALEWWKERCREWCSEQPDTINRRWGDQKYLDELPKRFNSVSISNHRGIDAAPWNTIYNNFYKIESIGPRIRIDGDTLVAYHFACMDIFGTSQFDLWNLDKIDIDHQIKSLIYLPYLNELRRSAAMIRTSLGADLKPFFSNKNFSDAKTTYFFTEKGMELLDWDGKYGICTISSRTYVAKTLALYTSLRRYLENFQLWICCMDEFSYSILLNSQLENVTLLRVADVETPAIAQTRAFKTLAEYCWTLKPALCTYIFGHFNTDRLIYCDSDIYFFSHPLAIYETWRGYSTFINRQLGTKQLEDAHGMYQAGMLGFTRTPESFEILHWWLARCTEWCYNDHSKQNLWGDQKYLNQIPDKFYSIKINDSQNIVAAPWNLVMNNQKNISVSSSNGDTYLGDEKLIAYHFGSLNIISEDSFDLWKLEPLDFKKDVIDHIYMPYAANIRNILRGIRAMGYDIQLLYADSQTVFNPLKLNS